MRYALCMGINDYPGDENDLSGCVNDVSDMAQLLTRRGFAVNTLVDAAATRAAMLAQMQAVLQAAAGHDSVVITYSGHGTWMPDISGDEPDKRDEAWCPHDFEDGVLLDDDIYATIATYKQPDVRLLLLADSCHSGTVCRAIGPDLGPQARPRYMPPSRLPQYKTLAEVAASRTAPPRGKVQTVPGTVLISGCADREVSYDASFQGRPNGALTYFAINALSKLPVGVTYDAWYKAIRKRLPNPDYPQTPQLVCPVAAKSWRAVT